ncbi:MAG TPA: phosphoglycolate phosphatase [Xanthomonadaceae bacterium]|jgi:2-phosphoglycolate phosphatase|nr:phosphoglycolate phosphatase [Xanthomonadaceae bacterium]
MTTLRIDCILFDLDGTLVDSAPDLLAAVNRVLVDTGREQLPLATLRPVVSKGSRAMLATAFPDLDDEAREQLVQPFLDYYGAAIAEHGRAFDDIELLLSRLERAGLRWGIVTNKPEKLARAVVQAMGWSERCAVLIGGDTLAAKKPDPAQLLHASELLGFTPDRCVYVGDDERDIQAARAAGMPSVVALWGYREAHEDPASWGADRSIGFPLELCFGLVDGFGRDKY